MKEPTQLLSYLTGRYQWKHIFGFEEEGGDCLDLYGKSFANDYWNYVAAITTNGELRLIKKGRLIYTTKKEFTDGDGI